MSFGREKYASFRSVFLSYIIIKERFLMVCE